MANLILRIGNRSTVNVRDYAEASARYAEERDESGEGASTFPDGTLMLGRKKVARVSYNGRVWSPEPWDWRSPATPLFDPSASVERAQ